MTKQIEELIDRIDLIDTRVQEKFERMDQIVDERVTTVLKIERLIRGFKWNWLLVQIVTLGLVANCAYDKGEDDTIEWYEDQEEEEVWKATRYSSPNIKFEKSGARCTVRRYPIRLRRINCSLLA